LQHADKKKALPPSAATPRVADFDAAPRFTLVQRNYRSALGPSPSLEQPPMRMVPSNGLAGSPAPKPAALRNREQK